MNLEYLNEEEEIESAGSKPMKLTVDSALRTVVGKSSDLSLMCTAPLSIHLARLPTDLLSVSLTRTQTYEHPHTHHTHTHTRTQTLAETHAYAQVHTHIHTHTHMHVHIYHLFEFTRLLYLFFNLYIHVYQNHTFIQMYMYRFQSFVCKYRRIHTIYENTGRGAGEGRGEGYTYLMQFCNALCGGFVTDL
mmetsp:Transcript_88580/g.143491  ORF Transcript_88580/g.143491 Transcript_88580/m.143491 type:complete len:190 (+) Transcript_88580:445-1014(+)